MHGGYIVDAMNLAASKVRLACDEMHSHSAKKGCFVSKTDDDLPIFITRIRRRVA